MILAICHRKARISYVRQFERNNDRLIRVVGFRDGPVEFSDCCSAVLEREPELEPGLVEHDRVRSVAGDRVQTQEAEKADGYRAEALLRQEEALFDGVIAEWSL